ncbi:MAG: radical SAM protein [Candidatus Bathyarchaeia archaeon]|jgi:nitrogen fixation protein NifB
MDQIAICTEAEESSSPLLGYTKAQAQKKSCASMLREHPHLDVGRVRFSRLKLVVASASNVGNNYCDSKNAKPKVTTAKEGIAQIRSAAKNDPRLRAIEVSGAGDALTSEATFEILRMIREEFPYFTTCVVSNGLLLPRKLALLQDLGVHAVKVAVNAVDADVGQQIYNYIRLNGKTLRGREAFEVLSINQLEGLRNAADAGLMVEVDAAYIPGVNSEHLVEVAKIVRSLGAYVMNIVPLTPSVGFDGLGVPSVEEMAKIRCNCENVVASEVLLHASPVASRYVC